MLVTALLAGRSVGVDPTGCCRTLRPKYQALLASGNLKPSEATELVRLSPRRQDTLFHAIRTGGCRNYNNLRTSDCRVFKINTKNGYPRPRYTTLNSRLRKQNPCTVPEEPYDWAEIPYPFLGWQCGGRPHANTLALMKLRGLLEGIENIDTATQDVRHVAGHKYQPVD